MFTQFGFRICITSSWPMEKSSTLSTQVGFSIGPSNYTHECGSDLGCFSSPTTWAYSICCVRSPRSKTCRNSHLHPVAASRGELIFFLLWWKWYNLPNFWITSDQCNYPLVEMLWDVNGKLDKYYKRTSNADWTNLVVGPISSFITSLQFEPITYK